MFLIGRPPASGTTLTAPTPSASPSATAPAVLTTGGIPCTVANIEQQMNTPARAIDPIPGTEQHYYTVLGCADGWLVYAISDDGARALQLDEGNAWYHVAKLQNGRFLFDVQAPWSTVFSCKIPGLEQRRLAERPTADCAGRDGPGIRPEGDPC